MNEDRNNAKDSHGHYTAKAIAPRWNRDGLLSPPKFRPHETEITESSTSVASVSHRRSESQSDTKCCPSSETSTSADERIYPLVPEAPIHLEQVIAQIESGENSRTSYASNTTHSHYSWREGRFPTPPLGWVGKRALKYQVRLSLQD